jgi:hypothetical protein
VEAVDETQSVDAVGRGEAEPKKSLARASIRLERALTAKGYPRLVLAGSGIGILIAAIALAAVDRAPAPASALVVAGAGLLAAAVFFERVREIGPSGVKLDSSLLDEVEQELPKADDVAAAEERNRIFDVLRSTVSEEPEATVEPTPLWLEADRVVSQYEQARELEKAAAEWVRGAGWQLDRQVVVPGPWRPDLVALRDRELLVLESKIGHVSDPDRLSDHLVGVAERIASERDLPTERAKAWLAVDILPPEAYLDVFRKHGIGLLHIEPSSGTTYVAHEAGELRA